MKKLKGFEKRRSWPLQLLGLASAAFALAFYKHLTTHNTFQTISLAVAYAIGVGLGVYPWLNRRYRARSLLIVAGIVLLAIVAAYLVITWHYGSLIDRHPKAVKPILN